MCFGSYQLPFVILAVRDLFFPRMDDGTEGVRDYLIIDSHVFSQVSVELPSVPGEVIHYLPPVTEPLVGAWPSGRGAISLFIMSSPA